MARFTISIISLMSFVLILVEQNSAKIDPETVLGIWLLDENKGGVARDSSKNSRDGKITGSLKVVKAKFNKGFEFEGKLNNYVSVPHDKSLNLADFTITYWSKMGGQRQVADPGAKLIRQPEGLIEMWTSRPLQQAVTSASIFLKVRISGKGPTAKQ